MTPGERLRSWFDAQKNLTMEALAQELGTNRASVRQWMNGKGFPRNEFCEKIYLLMEIESFSPENRDAARKQFEAGIPAAVKKARKEKYDANPEVYRKRALASYHQRYEAQREFVDPPELETLRKEPRQMKNVCRNCGEILRDVGPHLARCPVQKMTAKQYKERWHFLRSRNATRSQETQLKQSAAMKKARHQPPKWTYELLPLAQKASLKTNVPGSARLEERLNARGKVLGARPQFWKRSEDGDVVSDAKIAQLRLQGKSTEKIAQRVGMTLTPVHNRLKRLGFPRKARVFQRGEPVNAKSFVALMFDFNLSVAEAAERVGISMDWAGRLVRGKTTEWLRHDVAGAVVKARKELLRLFRAKPATGEKGVGRPRRLPAADERRMVARYEQLQNELKALRAWIRGRDRVTIVAIWDWLCSSWRRRQLRGLQFSPDFFAWVAKNYVDPTFCNGEWVPFELAREFTAYEFDVTEGFLVYVLTHGLERIAQK